MCCTSTKKNTLRYLKFQIYNKRLEELFLIFTYGPRCWIHDSKWSLLISGPVCVCLVVSLAFLINIVRVLVVKLNASRRVTRTVRHNSGRLLNNDQQNQHHHAARGSCSTTPPANNYNETTRRRESAAPGAGAGSGGAGGNDSASSLRKVTSRTCDLTNDN